MWWDQSDHSLDHETAGRCHCGPPGPGDSGYAEFPVTLLHFWCSEFKHKDPTKRELPDVHELMTILHQVSGEWLKADEAAKEGEETS